MKIYRPSTALTQYLRLVKEEDSISRTMPTIPPFFKKDVIFFNDIVCHAWIEKPYEKPKHCRIMNNIFIHFPKDWFEEDVFEFEKFLNSRIHSFEKHCKCYIACGYTSLINNTWSSGSRFDLILGFLVEEFPVRSDLFCKIKQVLLEAKDKYNIEYSDKKEDILRRIQKQDSKSSIKTL